MGSIDGLLSEDPADAENTARNIWGIGQILNRIDGGMGSQ